MAISDDKITCDALGCDKSIPINQNKPFDLALIDAKEAAEQKGWLLIGRKPELSAQFCFECAKAALSIVA